MNKAFKYSDINKPIGERDERYTTNFRNASASDVRYSSLIFKSVDSDFQEWEEPVDNYTLTIMYPTASTLYVNGTAVTKGTATDGYYSHIITNNVNNKNQFKIKLGTSSYIKSIDGCYSVTQTENNIEVHTLSNFSRDTVIVVERNRNSISRVTASNCSITVDGNTYTSGNIQKKLSEGQVKVVVTPNEGYSIISSSNTASSYGCTYTEEIAEDGKSKIYTTNLTYVNYLFYLNVTAQQNVTQIPISMVLGDTSAFSSVVINGESQTILNTISSNVLSNAVNFTFSLTLNDNYSVSSVKVNNVSQTITSGTYTVTLDGSTGYNIEVTTSYTEPTLYQIVLFDNYDNVDITIHSPAGTIVSKTSTDSGDYSAISVPYTSQSPAVVEFSYTINSDYTSSSITADGCTIADYNGHKRLTNFTKSISKIGFNLQAVEPEPNYYNHLISITGVEHLADAIYMDSFTEIKEITEDWNNKQIVVSDENMAGAVWLGLEPQSGYKVVYSEAQNGEILYDGADSENPYLYVVKSNGTDVTCISSFSVIPVAEAPKYNYSFTKVNPEGISSVKATYGGVEYDVTNTIDNITYDAITLNITPESGYYITVEVNNGQYSNNVVTASNSDDTVQITITATQEEQDDPDYKITVYQKNNISLAKISNIDVTDDVAVGDAEVSISTLMSAVNFSFTSDDAYDIISVTVQKGNGSYTYTAEENNTYKLTRNGRNVTGRITLNELEKNITIGIECVETLGDLTFNEDSGSSKKWVVQNSGSITYLKSPSTIANLLSSHLLCFNNSLYNSSTDRIGYIKLKFKSSDGVIPTSNSVFYFGTSDTLNTSDKASSSNSLVDEITDTSKIYINSISNTEATVTFDLTQVSLKKYIYFGFRRFLSSGYVYVSSYQYRKYYDGSTIQTASVGTNGIGTYDGTVIIDGNVIMECDPSGESLPYNSYDFTIVDEEAMYNPLTPGNKVDSFVKYQDFIIYGVAKDYAVIDGIIVNDDPYVTQVARVKFNGIKQENGQAQFNFIGTIEYYDNIQMTDYEKQQFCSLAKPVNVKTFLNTLFGSDIDFTRVNGTGEVFTDLDIIIVPFSTESKSEIARIVAQAFGMYIFEDNNGKIRFRTVGDFGARYPFNWMPLKAYAKDDYCRIFADDVETIYKCTTAHTSRSTFDDTEKGKWQVYSGDNFTFKLELEQSFSNPQITSNGEKVDGIDVSYHSYSLGATEEVKFSVLEAYYMPNNVSEDDFDVLNPELWIKYFESNENDESLYFDNSGNKSSTFQPYLNGIDTNYVKFRYNFSQPYDVDTLRFVKSSLMSTFLSRKIGKSNNITAKEMKDLVLYCYRVSPDNYKNIYGFKRYSPGCAITENYIDFIFALNDIDGLSIDSYIEPIGYSTHPTGYPLSTTPKNELIVGYGIDVLVYCTKMTGKPINDKTTIYHYLPFGTSDNIVKIDNPLIASQINAIGCAMSNLILIQNNMFEISNDWKGDCTVAVGDTILNALPIGTDYSSKTYDNFKSGVCKYINYEIGNGLSANTKISLSDDLFFSLENEQQFETDKRKTTYKIGDKVS